MQLQTVDPKDFGIPETKAQEIEALFVPMLSKMSGLEKEYNELIGKEVTPELQEKAKELRLKFRDVRTGTAKIHKEAKAFYLAAGRFVDGFKNTQLAAGQGIEDKLKEIEDYFENLRKEEYRKLQEERAEKLRPFLQEEEAVSGDLFLMSEDVWNNFLAGCKVTHEQRIQKQKEEEEAAKKETERIAKQEEENRKLREENERLAAEKRQKEEEEKKAEEERKAEEQALLRGKDRDKVEALLSEIQNLQGRFSFRSKTGKECLTELVRTEGKFKEILSRM